MAQGFELQGITRIASGETHLHELELAFEPGSFTVLLGRTGAGKTSLLRVLAGLDRPTRGRVLRGGADVTRLDVRRRDVAMVYQQFVNYPSLTVYENIASPLRLQRALGRAEIDRRVREAAALLRLQDLLPRLPAELSGGQQQRTALARALVKDASLVLLDEPLANLDYKLREELRSELPSLFRERQAVVVYATAEPGEALVLGGRTAVLDEGRLLQVGPALEVYGAPQSERVARVFSDPEINLLDLEVTARGEARLGEGPAFAPGASLRALAAGRYRLGVRAHHLRLARAADTDLCLRTTALLEESDGGETRVHAAFGRASITAQVPGVYRHPRGAPLELFVAPSRLLLFEAGGARIAQAVSAVCGLPAAAHGAD